LWAETRKRICSDGRAWAMHKLTRRAGSLFL
jgi:hypothetical protein